MGVNCVHALSFTLSIIITQYLMHKQLRQTKMINNSWRRISSKVFPLPSTPLPSTRMEMINKAIMDKFVKCLPISDSKVFKPHFQSGYASNTNSQNAQQYRDPSTSGSSTSTGQQQLYWYYPSYPYAYYYGRK